MDQCSWHDTPPAISVNLTNWSGHDLPIEIEHRHERILTDQWLGDGIDRLGDPVHCH
jgi:hypothetical protein